MKAILFNINGKYAHFKMPYTNNNPQSHSFITKTALIGMIGAVNGIDRNEMLRLFPLLSDNLKYGVHILSTIKKDAIGFTLYNVEKKNKSPKYIEHLKNPNYDILLSYNGNNIECEKIFDTFCYNIKNNLCSYQPYMGLQNCPCDISYKNDGDLSVSNGEFDTNGFTKYIPIISDDFINLYKEKIPTHQDDNWYNNPDKYVNIYFTDSNKKIKSNGEYYIFNNTNWSLC
jgi:CRISPR-associated protein Cas5 subtype I-B